MPPPRLPCESSQHLGGFNVPYPKTSVTLFLLFLVYDEVCLRFTLDLQTQMKVITRNSSRTSWNPEFKYCPSYPQPSILLSLLFQLRVSFNRVQTFTATAPSLSSQLLSFTLPSCPGLNVNTHQSLLFIASNQFSSRLLVTSIKEMPLPRLRRSVECHPCKVDTFKSWSPAPTGHRRFSSVRTVICSLPKLTYWGSNLVLPITTYTLLPSCNPEILSILPN